MNPHIEQKIWRRYFDDQVLPELKSSFKKKYVVSCRKRMQAFTRALEDASPMMGLDLAGYADGISNSLSEYDPLFSDLFDKYHGDMSGGRIR